ncbi:ATP-binding protein [Paenibacillus macquariensis]|uniref:histidine kinase n=1 Tax=Paenibacillus macquariensis TaxID=948756 RepID=A0ABY1JXT2_9BACL|nr:ATP-binding protein [Paenibacillus macquariensis]SIQ95295.1 signal transduction histidine kinase, LytS [Paenibacillus macquariensis]
MKRINYSKLIGILLIFSISLGLFIGIYSLIKPSSNILIAKNGVLDLAHWDFASKGLANLNGEWEFYEDQLLEPSDFIQDSPVKVSYLKVPSIWMGEKVGKESMNRKGYGTYRLKVLVSNEEQIYGLKINSIRMSHRLFINGQLEGEMGRPAVDEEAHTPGNTPYSTFFHTNGREIEIVIQVANYVYMTGGIVNSIQFGLDKDIGTLSGIQLGINVSAIMIFGMFGAYHLSFYLLRRREKSYLLSGLYLLTLLLLQLFIGEKIGLRLFPNIPFIFAYKLLDFSIFLSAVVIILFFHSIDVRLLSKRKIYLVISPIVFFLLIIIVVPYQVHSVMKPFFLLYLGIIELYLLGRMVYLYNRNEEDLSDRKEMILFIGAIISLGIYMTFGILYTENAVDTALVGTMGVVGFITFMNILLALRFTNAYEKTEILSHQLMISNQLKDEFLTNTSHELKTPLHGIMNITSYLLDDEEHILSVNQKQNLRLIKDTSIKLSMLINDIIDLTRLKHGELRLYPTAVDLKMVTQIVFDVLEFELLGKNVKLVNLVESEIWVLADENRLRQILYNLIQNAIKHTEKGSIKVISHVVDDKVVISVEDTGSGIAEDKHEEIFEYFVQVNEPLPQDGYTSMGVGLYISRKLVEQMNGYIRVEWSEVGMGTRMTFTLPSAVHTQVYREAASTSMNQSLIVCDDPLDFIDQYEYTVLIVDDEASNIRILLNILKRHHYNVITAFSANEALAKLKEYPQVDLVILDVMMPRISGIELCQMLRGQYSILDLPILFATSKDSPQDIALGFRAGANDYVTKPFDAETLIARVQTLIAMKTAIEEAILNELAFHHAQIKPHFLYNALSSVISFCYTDGDKAAYLLSMLSQYLRYILDMDRTTQFVPLHQELELIHAYVEIEKARFGERFEFIVQVEESVRVREIPSLCIQPFVENAIRHGLFEKDGYGKVSLMIDEGDEYIKICIEDDGVGIPDDLLYQMIKGDGKVGGIGIENIRKRMDVISGATFTISSDLGLGTKVTIYLPVHHDGN